MTTTTHHAPHCDLDPYDDECSWCDMGMVENDDPMWNGFDVDFVPCSACNGTGLRCQQRIF